MEQNSDRKIERKRILFRGRVQGVGFRYIASREAKNLRLTGWVKNNPDGTVEMEAQGELDKIYDLIRYLRSDDNYIRIEDLEMSSVPVVARERGFSVKYSGGYW